jgi:hypothetical protein
MGLGLGLELGLGGDACDLLVAGIRVDRYDTSYFIS